MKKINGLSVYTAGDPSKMALVFVHGYPFSADMWSKQISDLKADYYCVSYDIRGLGDSEKEDGLFTMEQFAEDLLSVVKEMNLDKPVVISLSMGGYITYRTLDKNPGAFRGAVFCGTKTEADGNEAKLKRAGSVKKINEEGPESFIRGFVPTTFWAQNLIDMKNEYEAFVSSLLNTPASSLKGCQLAMSGRNDNSHVPGNMNMPALFICGEHDALSPLPVMKKDAGNWKGSEFVVINGAGHLSPFERPAEVNRAIRAFLAKF